LKFTEAAIIEFLGAEGYPHGKLKGAERKI